MRRYLALTLACMLATVPFSALALGLGEIRLNSWLNQRLDAEIELVSAAADELESLKINLADPGMYARYGIERTTLLNTLQFNIVRRPNGTAYVHVTSSEPIKEPFLTFLIEADWSRGQLMREYTVLLDPPTFASERATPATTQAPAVVPQAPVAAPAEEAAVADVIDEKPAAVPDIVEPQPEPVYAEEPAPVEETTGDVISIPPLDAEVEQPAAAPVFPQVEANDSYGPIQRNETLWGIAMRLRPDESITINQMMLALYRANPEAFQGNINRLKAGYILRIPEYSEITGIGRSEAFQEAKRQNEEWRAERFGEPLPAPAPVEEAPEEAFIPEPELSLVAPEETDFAAETETDTGLGAGDEAGDAGMALEEPLEPAADEDIDAGAVDLGVEAETPDRLLDVEDESMQALQAQEELAPAEEELPTQEPAPETADMLPPPLPEEQAAETAPEEIVSPDALPEETAPAADVQADVQTEPEPATAAPVIPRPREPGMVERMQNLLLSPLGMGAGAAVLALLLAGFLVMRKRRAGDTGAADDAMAGWGESEDVTAMPGDDDDATVIAGGEAESGIGAVFAHDMDHEDTGTTKLDDDTATQMLEAEADAAAEKTQFMRPEEKAAAVDLTATVTGGQAMTLDDNDPLSEADFHMAYGLYDQAAEVVQKATQRDPERADLHAKLAEIHFAANNTDGFIEAAGRLKELAGPGHSEWDNIAIMGRQIAPDNPLFAATGGAATAAVDLDFGAAAEEFGETGLQPPVDAAPAGDSLDFDVDIGGGETPQVADEPEAAPVAADADDGDLDFDLGLDSAASDNEPATTEAGGDFDLGDLGLDDAGGEAEAVDGDRPVAGDADTGLEDATQTEFDKALEELSAFVDTNLPEQDAGDAVDAASDGELNLDEFSFDESATASASDDDTGIDAEEDESDIGEIGTKLDLARAYIDMGDPDGARGILEEVMADGDAGQQQEAKQLLEQIA